MSTWSTRRTATGGIRRVALVGRERELHRARAALREGRPVAIAGVAGMGRTALARAALDGISVAWGCGLVTLMQRPYAALECAVADEAPDGGDTATEGARAAEVAAWVTARLGGRALFVDDLHLANRATAEVLGHLAGHVPLVVTMSTGHRVAPALRRQVSGWPGLQSIELAPLDRQSAVRLVRRHAPLLDTTEAEQIAGDARGVPGELVAAADRAAAWARPAVAAAAAQPYRASLSPRQTEVLGLIAAGGTSSHIARRLGIAESTVESHVRAIRSKLGAPTRTAAVAWAS